MFGNSRFFEIVLDLSQYNSRIVITIYTSVLASSLAKLLVPLFSSLSKLELMILFISFPCLSVDTSAITPKVEGVKSSCITKIQYTIG